MNRDLTTKKFHSGGKAGAEDTEKRKDIAFGKGGRNKDVGEQNADVAQPGRTGHRDGQSNAGKKFGVGGPAVPGKKSAIGIAAEAAPSVTGNARGSAANSARGPRRDKTRDYGKR